MNGEMYSNRNTMRISKDVGYSKDNSKSLYVGGYAKRGSVMFRDIDRFYECLRFCAFFRWNRAGKEVFLRTVL